MEAASSKLIVGLGNPGTRYAHTRHNFGFLVLDELAKEEQVKFKKQTRFNAEIAKIEASEQIAYLLKPQTFMNLSGLSLRRCIDFYKIKIKDILVVVDDASLDFEEVKIKPKGGSAGHNGLKDIECHIGKDYARLKMGIGQPGRMVLEDYVLERFNAKEVSQLGHVIDMGTQAIRKWLADGLERTMNEVNTKMD